MWSTHTASSCVRLLDLAWKRQFSKTSSKSHLPFSYFERVTWTGERERWLCFDGNNWHNSAAACTVLGGGVISLLKVYFAILTNYLISNEKRLRENTQFLVVIILALFKVNHTIVHIWLCKVSNYWVSLKAHREHDDFQKKRVNHDKA